MEYISKKYYKKLKEKLFNLEKKKPKIIKQIQKSIEKGDLSENYEYISLKEALELLDLKINKIKKILLNSKIINKLNKNNNRIKIFSTVTIKNLKTQKNKKVIIVYPSESNIFKNKISIESKLSSILIGKKKGEIVNLGNNIKYKIIKIK